MKYGIYYAYWEKEWNGDYKYYIDKISKLGFDILEISCGAFSDYYTKDQELIDIGKYAKEKGVTLTAGYGPHFNESLSSSEPNTQKQAISFWKETLRKLKLMDIHIVGGALYGYWPVDYSKPFDKKRDLENSIKNMKIISQYAEEYDIMMGMEVLNRFEGYMLNTCDEALAYVEEVGSSNVGVMLDTFHMNIEEDNIAVAIRKAGDRLCHFHIGEGNRKVPGKGMLPWNEIGQALRDINYQHAAVMEPFVMQGGTVGHDIKIWRDIIGNCSEVTLDMDAQSALHFVKHVFEV